MGRLIFDYFSFDNLNRLKSINDSLIEFIDTVSFSFRNKDSHSILSSINSHVFDFGNFFDDLVFSPWENVNNNLNLSGINQTTHQSLSNTFFAFPNGGKYYSTFEEFEADGNNFFGYIGINEFISRRYPYIDSYVNWLEWRAKSFRENNNLIDWKEITNSYFPNLFYSNFILANKLKVVKRHEKIVDKLSKEYCDNFNQMKLSRGELMALADELGTIIAEANYYVYENELSQAEGRLKKSNRKIYSLTLENGKKQYLSIDFHKCFCFEVCDDKGRHLGEYRFDGLENGSNTRDDSGNHDILAVKD